MSSPEFLKDFTIIDTPVAKTAYNVFNKLGVPTNKNENWHYTNLNKILGNNVYDKNTRTALTSLDIEGCIKMVIGNGSYGLLEDDQVLPDGIDISPVMDLQYSSKLNEQEQHAMVALNTSIYDDGICITVSKDMDKPLHLAYVNSGDSVASFPRVFLKIENVVTASLIETYESISGDKVFVNAVNEILVGKESKLTHYKIQEDESETNHIAFTKTSVLEKGDYNQTFVFLNGNTTRNEVNIDLLGEFASCEVNGIYITDNEQLVDNTVCVNHFAPNCESSQLFKGILNDKSKGVFQGKVYVDKEAQKTDGYQMHRAVMLSRDCEVLCKPELEIYADDVKCSHGASTGEIDKEQLFYLQARGIDKNLATNMLLEAFLVEVLDNVDVENIQKYLRKVVLRRTSYVLNL